MAQSIEQRSFRASAAPREFLICDRHLGLAVHVRLRTAGPKWSRTYVRVLKLPADFGSGAVDVRCVVKPTVH